MQVLDPSGRLKVRGGDYLGCMEGPSGSEGTWEASVFCFFFPYIFIGV